MDYPRFVFYVPGPNQAHGFTYDHLLVNNDKEFKDAIDSGYAETLPGAKEKFDSRDEQEPEPGIGTASKRRGRPPKGESNGNQESK